MNRALMQNLARLLEATPDLHVIHISGQLDWPEVQTFQQSFSPVLNRRYHPYAYLHEMGNALAAADLIVCRAGASALGELPYFGLPAILVPYPYAWRYQKVNAAYLCDRQAAVMLRNEDLEVDLLTTIQNLINDSQRLHSMRSAMQALARPHAAEEIANLIRKLCQSNGGTA